MPITGRGVLRLKAVWRERYIVTDPKIVETKDRFWPPVSSFVNIIFEYF